jgi:hypothetical protein
MSGDEFEAGPVSMPLTFAAGTWDEALRDTLFPPVEYPLGVIEGNWPCPRCDVRIPFRAPVERIEALERADRTYATIENHQELRDHVATEHGLDPDDTTPLRIIVEVKR